MTVHSPLRKSMNPDQSSRHFNHALARLSQEELRHLVSNLAFQLRRTQQRRPQNGQPMMPRMDIFDDPDSQTIVAHVEIPGMRKEDVTLQVHDGVLIIAGERRPAVGGEWLPTSGMGLSAQPSTSFPVSSGNSSTTAPSTPQSKFRVQELKYGRFRRVINVPAGLDANEVTASMTDGMLLITWPREPAALHNLDIDVD